MTLEEPIETLARTLLAEGTWHGVYIRANKYETTSFADQQPRYMPTGHLTITIDLAVPPSQVPAELVQEQP